MREGNRGDWPLITLNLDFKDNKPEHLAAVLDLLRKYQPWLTSTVKAADPTLVQLLDVRPILAKIDHALAPRRGIFGSGFSDELHRTVTICWPLERFERSLGYSRAEYRLLGQIVEARDAVLRPALCLTKDAVANLNSSARGQPTRPDPASLSHGNFG